MASARRQPPDPAPAPEPVAAAPNAPPIEAPSQPSDVGPPAPVSQAEAPVAKPVPPAVKPAPAAPVSVTLVTNAWADVFVDGASLGRIPRAKPFSLSPGRHRLRLSSPFVETLTTTMDVPPHGPTTVQYRLKLRTGLVTFAVDAPSRVRIEGQWRVIEREATVALAYGSHEVTVARAGAPDRTRVVSVTPDSARTVRLE
jgi:hypothetical protein